MKLHLTIALLFFTGIAISQTLTLKPGYGNAGISSTNLSNDGPHFTYATGKQSDGKMLLGGSGLIRIFPNGNTDSSFGTNGMAFKADFPEVNTLAVQTDDKILCVFYDYSQVIIKRFLADGKTDSSFNGNGTIILSEPGKIIYINKIRLQQDGKILLAGNSLANEKTSFFVARYLPDGTPDLSFNTTGKLIVDLSLWDNNAFDIAEQSTGKLVVAGSAKSSVTGDLYLVAIRLNNDGSRDMGFNGTGIVQYSNSGETANLLYLYNDDKILIAGSSGQQLLLMRLLPDGAADNSFSTDGMLTEAGNGNSFARQIELLNDNSILISGQTSATMNPFSWNYAAFKFDANGNPDNIFNGNGKTFLSFQGNDYCAGSMVLNDGSILLGGYNDENIFANTAKINSDGTFDITYGTNGIKFLKINGSDEIIYNLLQQPDGKLIAIGNKTDMLASVHNTVLVRYKTDGSVDSSFGNNGIFYITEPGFIYHSATLQPDNKILLSGDKNSGDPDVPSAICVIRLNDNGSIDNNFGTNGIALVSSANTSGSGKGINILADGKIMVAGKDAVTSNLIVLARLLTDGSPDNDFGTVGRKTVSLAFPENGLGSFTIQNDNKILLGGYVVGTNGASSFFCLRLMPNGDTDNSFATNGLYRTGTSTFDFIELNAALQIYNDKILLTGQVVNPTDLSGSVCVIRLLPNGTPDNSFSSNGIRTYYKRLNSDSTFLIPNAVAVHPDSSIYITGDAYNTIADHEQFIIRIRQNGLLDSTISSEGSGWNYPDYGGLTGSLNDIIISADSTVFVAGSRDAIGTNNDFLIAAYKRLPDIQGTVYVFNGNGLWTDAANWLNTIVPPVNLPNGATIIVDPAPAGTAMLNIQQNIEAGGKIIVKTGAKLVVQGNLKIGN